MRIAYLSVFPPYRGGIAQYAASLTAALGENHELKHYNFKRQYPNFLFPGKTQYLEEKEAWQFPSERTLDMLNPFTYWQTAQQIVKDQPELLIINYWMPFFAPALGSIAYLVRKKGVKVVAVLHNLIPHEKRLGDDWLNRFFINQIDGFLVMGSSVKKDLLQMLPNASFIQHPHPLYAHFAKAPAKAEAQTYLKVPKGKRVLLFFGLIRAYKGLDVLIQALDYLSDEYVLLIAGESYEDYSRYQQLIEANKNKDRIIEHIRYVSDEEVPSFFASADLCVLPYKSATQSGVVSVAFNFDLPVLVTEVGSLKEMVSTFQGGMTVERAEPHLLAQQIERFFESTQNYPAQIAQNKEQFSWKSLAGSIEKLYEK